MTIICRMGWIQTTNLLSLGVGLIKMPSDASPCNRSVIELPCVLKKYSHPHGQETPLHTPVEHTWKYDKC